MQHTITALDKDSFDAFLETTSVVVVYFWAAWCQPCHAFQKTFEQVATQYPTLRFGKVDIEAEPELMQDFNIRSVPTVGIFREHVALCMESGALSAKTFSDLIDQAVALDMNTVHKKIAKQMVHGI